MEVTPSNEAIRAQLQRIISGATFHGAQRASRLLEYLVEQTLSGKASGIKEFTVGVDALGRGDSFDPRTDSIARVEASRLRNRLDLYYAKEGLADPVRITLPRGGYVPVFGPRVDEAASRTVAGRQRWPFLGAAALLTIVAMVAGITLYGLPKPVPLASQVGTSNPEAHQLYLQGLYFSSKPTRQGIQKAIEYYKQAIAKDPLFARAYVNLATCYELRSAEEGPGTWLVEAKKAVTQAIRIDDTLAEAHAELGFLNWIHDLDATGAEKELKLALELDPRSATAHFNYSRVLAETGRFEEALVEANRAITLDPLSIQIRKRLPYVLFLARRYDEAMLEYRKLIELAPDFVQAQRELGLVYEQKGMFDQALQQLQLVAAMPENYAATMARADIGHLHAVSGRHADARNILAELVGKSEHSYVSAYDIAVIHAGLNEPGPAIVWLARAIEQRPFFIGWLNVDPRLDGLRKDSRFGGLLTPTGS